MSWNYNTSLNRVETHLQGMGEIEVERLVRTPIYIIYLSKAWVSRRSG